MTTIKNKFISGALAVVIACGAAVAAPSNPGQQEDGSATLREIRKKLVTLPYYGVFDNLAYKLEGDTVILYGQVVRPSTRKDAERRIRKIEGIEQVVNNIEVLPLSQFDDRIRVRIFRSLFRFGGLNRYAAGVNPSIHIIVKGGHVTLEGVVANKSDSQLAYIAANQVPDVFSVTNNLRIEGKGEGKY
jgi:hyperosmotically inducible periplasmic protein